MSDRQSELGFQTTAKAGSTSINRESKVATSKRFLQDVLSNEGFWAVREAANHDNIDSLRKFLLEHLPQQSAETRSRYVYSILKWFFPDNVPNSVAVRVWRAYGDEVLTNEVLRVLYLKSEPIVGECVADSLYPIQENAAIPVSYFDSYLSAKLGDTPVSTRKRLRQNLRKLGFISNAGKGRYTLRGQPASGTALLLLFTHYFAPNEPRTIELRNTLSDPFWKYLGFKSEDAVRKVFRSAMEMGLLSKYVVADRIESVTTKFTLEECLGKKVKL